MNEICLIGQKKINWITLLSKSEIEKGFLKSNLDNLTVPDLGDMRTKKLSFEVVWSF